jgi:iron complex transport system ATP-binding protein
VESNNALAVKNLTYRIGTARILEDVSFPVSGGEFISVVGPNGAGKTTLLRCVMRIVDGWTGSIGVQGEDLASYRQRELARLISYVPQADGRWFPYTGRQLVMMGRYPYLSPFSRLSAQDMNVVREALELTGTVSLADRDMRTLSGGERQKVLIAGALAQGAGIMLLDEPTTFLDPRHGDEVLDILAGLHGQGTTVIMVTHDINAAAAVSDRILALSSGRLVFSGEVGEFMDNRVLTSVYGKSFTLVKHPESGRKMVLP